MGGRESESRQGVSVRGEIKDSQLVLDFFFFFEVASDWLSATASTLDQVNTITSSKRSLNIMRNNPFKILRMPQSIFHLQLGVSCRSQWSMFSNLLMTYVCACHFVYSQSGHSCRLQNCCLESSWIKNKRLTWTCFLSALSWISRTDWNNETGRCIKTKLYPNVLLNHANLLHLPHHHLIFIFSLN